MKRTTAGQALAEKLGWPLAEGDDYHPAANKQKMMQGIPLTDEDRIPWLLSLHEHICQWAEQGVSGIVACSALKHLYRHILKQGMQDINTDVLSATRNDCATATNSRPAKFVFVLLKCSRKVLADRLQHREGHFFNSSLLQSQLDTFQEPLENDFDLIIDGTRTVNEIVDLIVSVL